MNATAASSLAASLCAVHSAWARRTTWRLTSTRLGSEQRFDPHPRVGSCNETSWVGAILNRHSSRDSARAGAVRGHRWHRGPETSLTRSRWRIPRRERDGPDAVRADCQRHGLPILNRHSSRIPPVVGSSRSRPGRWLTTAACISEPSSSILIGDRLPERTHWCDLRPASRKRWAIRFGPVLLGYFEERRWREGVVAPRTSKLSAI